jgi:calcineurin-like phosphoesterase family protein
MQFQKKYRKVLGNLYFGSDFHFDHDPKWDVPLWKARGFKSAEDSREFILNDINKRVQPEDTLVILGDFSLSSTYEDTMKYFRRIMCQNIIYLWGNHESFTSTIPIGRDAFGILLWENVEFAGYYLEIQHKKRYMNCCHYPIASWNHMRNAHMLHGHSHGAFKQSSLLHPQHNSGRILDVGVECALKYSNNTSAIFSFEEIDGILSKREAIKVDHH